MCSNFADCHLEGRTELQVESGHLVQELWSLDTRAPGVWSLAQALGPQLVLRTSERLEAAVRLFPPL